MMERICSSFSCTELECIFFSAFRHIDCSRHDLKRDRYPSAMNLKRDIHPRATFSSLLAMDALLVVPHEAFLEHKRVPKTTHETFFCVLRKGLSQKVQRQRTGDVSCSLRETQSAIFGRRRGIHGPVAQMEPSAIFMALPDYVSHMCHEEARSFS